MTRFPQDTMTMGQLETTYQMPASRHCLEMREWKQFLHQWLLLRHLRR